MIPFGELKRIEAPAGTVLSMKCSPAPGFDVGEGKGKNVTFDAMAGEIGIVIDCQGTSDCVSVGRPCGEPRLARSAGAGFLVRRTGW